MFVTSIYGGYASDKTWFKAIAESLILKLIQWEIEISKSGSQGGYLSIFEADPYGDPKLTELIGCGSFPKEKYGIYMYNSIEKAFRLNHNLDQVSAVSSQHTTSRQSANKNSEEYPGAVYFDDSSKMIFSFSGLGSEWDEFISVCISVFHSYLVHKRAYPVYLTLEDLHDIYSRRSKSITATGDQKAQMLGAMDEIIKEQIALRDKK